MNYPNRKNPEAVLNRAVNMLDLGSETDAWVVLSKFLSSKKRGWRTTHENMMDLFIDLSISLQRNPKDGFIQYKMICSTLHLDSLEKKLCQLLQKTQENGKKEFMNLCLKYEKQDMINPRIKKRFTKQQFTLPCLKFQWDVYRSVLDLLRNNQRLDVLYQEIILKSIQFCLKLGRVNEYRKLCELCRKHLRAIIEHQEQQNHVEIYTSEMFCVYVKTRLSLLENSIKLKMWQEAFRIMGDIHSLKEKSKTILDPLILKIYYKKLSQIFLESSFIKNNMLLHSCSMLKYYNLTRDYFDGLGKKMRKIEKEFPFLHVNKKILYI